MRSAGVRPVLRAAGAGVAAALLALLLFVRGLFELLDPGASTAGQIGAGSLVVFAAAALGGAAGAWQSALAGVPTRREIVVVGALCPGVAFAAASLVLSYLTVRRPGTGAPGAGDDRGRARRGASALPAVALALARTARHARPDVRRVHGALLLVAVIVAALVAGASGPDRRPGASSAVDAIIGGGGPSAQVAGSGGNEPGKVVTNPTADDDGDGLNNEEEAALGTDPASADSDGDGVSDDDEFSHGTDPTQGVQPLTEENLVKPLERIGISEDEWKVTREVHPRRDQPRRPGGLPVRRRGRSIVLDENGELMLSRPARCLFEDGKLKVSPLKENGIGGGLVKGLAKVLGAGGRSASAALKSALEKLSAGPRTRLRLRPARGPRAAETTAVLPRFKPGRWLPHFDDHAAEFGYKTPVEYLRGARDFVARIRRDVHPRRRPHQRRQALLRRGPQLFAVLKKDGVLRTYFRPKEGSEYWMSQIGQG